MAPCVLLLYYGDHVPAQIMAGIAFCVTQALQVSLLSSIYISTVGQRVTKEKVERVYLRSDGLNLLESFLHV